MSKERQTAIWIILYLALLSVLSSQLEGAEPPALRKIRAAFTSLSGSQAPPWIAREAGIFKKHGLDVELVLLPGGVQGLNALIAGEVPFLQITGSTTVSAAVGGADAMIIATTVGTLVWTLFARPEIERAEQLRGKAVGVTRFGTVTDTAARLALRHLGLVPEKDVALLQIGGVESIVPAMQGGRVQAGMLSYPSITAAKKLGYRILFDVASLGIPYASTGVTARAKLIRDDPDLVRRYLAAQVEAIARMKRDKSYAMSVMGKYLRTNDAELLSEAYEVFAQKYLMSVPLPTVEAIQPVLEELAIRNPKAKEQDPRKFFDDSFVRQLEVSHFIENLYR